ncbi:MAG: PAS domain S-box protein [Desulfobacula sp.]|nr:PAS domain S-box protein [Desulfobacula sp.]MBT7048197.1 PAS domain S-box protein [Desulfobacula sp.]
MVASTSKLSTFAHGHKYWWLGSYNNGKGAVFFDDRGYDDSVGGYVLGLVVPVKKGNEIIGILKCNLNILGNITQLITGTGNNLIGNSKLTRSGGRVVFEDGFEPLSTQIHRNIFEQLKNNDQGTIIIDDSKDKYLVGFSQIKLTKGERGYDFGGTFESIDHKKGNNGESWYVLCYRQMSVIQAPFIESIKLIIFISFVIIIILMLASYLFGKKITKPLMMLHEATKQIGTGNFEYEIPEQQNDEFGELALSFNIMSSHLKETTTTINTLNNEIDRRAIVEKELNDSERRYRSLIEDQIDLVCRITPDGKFVFVNDMYCQFFNKSKKELIGSKWRSLPVDDDIGIIKEKLSQLSFTNRIVIIENRVISGKGSIHWMQFINHGFFDAQENLLEIQSSGRDITERKLTEEKLKMAEANLKKTFDISPSIICKASLDTGCFTEVSPIVTKILGFSVAEFTSRPLIKFIHPDDRQKTIDEILKQQQGKDVTYFENRYLCKDGFYKWIAWQATPPDKKGMVTAVGSDITERKQAEEEKFQLEAQYQQAQKMESIGILAGGIAHELNTPIQYIGDNTNFLKEAFQDMSECLQVFLEFFESGKKNKINTSILEQVQSAIETADIEYIQDEIPSAIEQTLEGVKRVQKIVNAMKNFAHPGKNVHVQTNLNECIQDTVTISKSEWKYVAEMVLDLDSNLPMVNCDPGELNQVLLNLIVNASHAISANIGNDESNKGKIRITTKALKKWVEIMVSDTGTGIPDEIQSKIFNPFFTTKEIGKGTGQGLAITHSIVVDRHKGQIDVAASKNGGAVFIIKLPLNV